MNIRVYIATLLLMFGFISLFAQTDDYGVWTSVGAEKEIGKLTVSTATEYRTQSYLKQIDRWSIILGADYDIVKQFKIGASYQFIYFNDIKYKDFQPRNRFSFSLQDKAKLGRFTFTLRERVQVTKKDERDRIKKSGKINYYTINPEWIWRNRIKLAYNIPNFPVTPAFAFESFYQLNNPVVNDFNELRYTLSFDYSPIKHHEIEVFGLIDKEINTKNPARKFVVGIDYTFSF
jgi:hypothetical protein